MATERKKAGRKKKRERLARETRFDMVLNALWQCGRVGGCSRRDIAEMLNLTVSPHLINLVEDLVKQGWVDRTFNLERPSAGYRYFPSDRLEKWHAANSAA